MVDGTIRPTRSSTTRRCATRSRRPTSSRSSSVLISVPIGTLFAIGIDRWHGRPARGANFVMLLSFVVPEIILGTSLFILFTTLFTFVKLGTPAQTLGLAAFQVSYPAGDRPGPAAHDRAGVRGGGDGSGRHAGPGDPAGPPPAHLSGHLRERRARVRRRRRRLRDRERAVRERQQRDGGPEDLLGLAGVPHARGQRRRHRDADHDLADRRRRPALLPTVQPRTGRRRPTTSRSCSSASRAGRGGQAASAASSSRASSTAVAAASGSTRSASTGSAPYGGAGVERDRAALVRHPRLDALARRQVHDHLQHGPDVDDPLHHAGHAVLARRALRIEVHTLGADRHLRLSPACPRHPGPPTNENSPIATAQPPAVWPPAVASIRFDTPRKSAT